VRLEHCGEGRLVADDLQDGNFLVWYMRSRGETDRAGNARKPFGKLEGIGNLLLLGRARALDATVNSLVDAAITKGADLRITLSTPTLQAALVRRADQLDETAADMLRLAYI
jgi:hypothetical protein